eukprot:gene7201-12871_t
MSSFVSNAVLFVVLVFAIIGMVLGTSLAPKKIIRSKNNEVLVYDEVFSKKSLSVMSELLQRHGPWDFIYPEKYEGMHENDNGNLHWVANFSPSDFSVSTIWKVLNKKLDRVFTGIRYFPYSAQGILINRGDFPTVKKGEKEGDLLMRVFLTTNMKKNSYSELLFYNENEEIVGCVYPKYGRVVAWNDTVDFIFKPPSMNHVTGEYSLFIKATLDKSKFDRAVEVFKDHAKRREDIAKVAFPLSNNLDNSIYEIDLSKHLRKKFYDSQNQAVAVFDDVVPKDVLLALREYFFQYDSSYVYNAYDPAYDEGHDNVNWVAQVPARLLPHSKVWQYIHHITSYMSNETNWHPYDVSMNIIQHYHHPRIHTDCSEWEHEYTFLMYLTPDWSENLYGETIYFEETDKGKMKKENKGGNEKYETLGAVKPKFGRIVIFRNIIEHSARPPSPDFLAARYTFAVKVSRSPQIAIAKKLRELLGDIAEYNENASQLMQDLEDGKYNRNQNDGDVDFLNKQYSKFKDLKEKIDLKAKTRIYKAVSMSIPN